MKGAIFDIDGTILDSMNVWSDVLDSFLSENGISLSVDDRHIYQGMPFEDKLISIHEKYISHISLEDLLADLGERALYAYSYTLPAKEGVCRYIETLYNNGVKLAIATSGFPELVKPAFERLGIYKYFSVFTYSSEVGCLKSSPDIYLMCAERMGLKPSQCTVFEDIITGIQSAGGAGFSTVAVADPSNISDRERLIQCSDRYITGWNELLSNI